MAFSANTFSFKSSYFHSLFWVCPRHCSSSFAASRFFCSSTNREDQNHRRQYGCHNDELFTVMEFKQPESMLSTEQYDESTKSNGTILRPRRSRESFRPAVVRHPDIYFRKQQTLNEENSKMSFGKSVKGLEVSPSMEATGRNFVSENINGNSEFADISTATATHSFAAVAVDVEANFNQTEKIDGSRKALCTSGLSSRNYVGNKSLSDERSDVSMKSAVLSESTMTLSTNGLSILRELDEYSLFQETDGVDEKIEQLDTLDDAQLDEQQALQKRLCYIFDKILVVDNVVMARKVVHLLTQKYRHRVHACDTEACLLLQNLYFSFLVVGMLL